MDTIKMTSEAWDKIEDLGLEPNIQDGGNVLVWDVPFERAGFQGGKLGNGGVLDKVRIVYDVADNSLVTAFPK